jgi:geranylgeranyl diphosphate synthase type II
MKHDERSAQYREYIESYLKNYIQQHGSEPQKQLFDAMGYSLLAGGKRLRPVFAFDFCRMCGGNWEDAAPLAAAVEMIHTYSLIHDDLPSMDNDDFRRGRPTNHKVYGEAMAILAGDALLTDAFYVAAHAQLPDRTKMSSVIGILAKCAGSLGMVGGQVLDIMSESRELSEQEVLDIQSRKTGALIRAACTLGALAGGANEEQFSAAWRFADNLGLAFQIRDDMLDVIGTREEMGKGVGTDETKNTFVKLYGLERCEELVETYTRYAIEALDVFEDNSYMKALAISLTDRRV